MIVFYLCCTKCWLRTRTDGVNIPLFKSCALPLGVCHWPPVGLVALWAWRNMLPCRSTCSCAQKKNSYILVHLSLAFCDASKQVLCSNMLSCSVVETWSRQLITVLLSLQTRTPLCHGGAPSLSSLFSGQLTFLGSISFVHGGKQRWPLLTGSAHRVCLDATLS